MLLTTDKNSPLERRQITEVTVIPIFLKFQHCPEIVLKSEIVLKF